MLGLAKATLVQCWSGLMVFPMSNSAAAVQTRQNIHQNIHWNSARRSTSLSRYILYSYHFHNHKCTTAINQSSINAFF